jgi:tRNA A-37 threonylcarbamoyl transferase component Bud32
MKNTNNKTNKKRHKKGGNLCKNSPNITNDIYTLSDPFYTLVKNPNTGEIYPPTIFNVENNENLIIKKIISEEEYRLTRAISLIKDKNNKPISPVVYGLYNCEPDILYNDKTYMVMEKLSGHTLDKNINSKKEGIDNIMKYLDKIFELQNLLYDNGFILNDLKARNIMITDTNEVKFFDFDDLHTTHSEIAVPSQDRFSKTKLKKELISDFSDWYDYDNPVPIKNSKKKTIKKK